MIKKASAEFIGTFWLVLAGCGSAVLAASLPGMGIGLQGVALTFGLAVLTMACAISPISGCHLNPAVSIVLWAGGRFPARELPAYIVAQVLGAISGCGILYLIATGKAGFDLASSGFAANGYVEHSPGQYGMVSAMITEFVFTFMFLMVILGSTNPRAPSSLAPVAIGLGLTVIHLVSIPVTNTSINPARSTGPALWLGFAGQWWAMAQLWMFWLMPISGAWMAGKTYRWLGKEQDCPSDADD